MQHDEIRSTPDQIANGTKCRRFSFDISDNINLVHWRCSSKNEQDGKGRYQVSALRKRPDEYIIFISTPVFKRVLPRISIQKPPFGQL